MQGLGAIKSHRASVAVQSAMIITCVIQIALLGSLLGGITYQNKLLQSVKRSSKLATVSVEKRINKRILLTKKSKYRKGKIERKQKTRAKTLNVLENSTDMCLLTVMTPLPSHHRLLHHPRSDILPLRWFPGPSSVHCHRRPSSKPIDLTTYEQSERHFRNQNPVPCLCLSCNIRLISCRVGRNIPLETLYPKNIMIT